MSSDGSDDFDKEAEREKLREKYEADQKDRESTQRMSELLLQGATMTGKHCGDCGDPIFRYDGQEFCPTCQREVQGGQSDAGGAEADGDSDGASAKESATAPADGANAERSDEASARSSDDEPRVEIDDVRVADRHADRSDLRSPPSQRDPRAGRRDAERESAGHARDRDSPDRTNARRPRGSESGASAPKDLDAARASLVRTLNDLAYRAEETDDVARARELLAATREAAEALDALERTGR